MKTPFGKKIALLLVLTLVTASMVAPITSSATSVLRPVNGRILSTNLTGDNVNWVEIADYGNYSLIIRSSYLNWYPQPNKLNDPLWQYVPFSAGTTSYAASSLYTRINNWFNGTAPGQYADNLSPSARLRQFTMENNAKLVPGTASTKAGQSNGFSLPFNKQRGTGNDIAFVLSFSEASNFISTHNFERGRVPTTGISNSIAIANANKIKIPPVRPPYEASGIWLRSPGDIAGTVGVISQELNYRARAFQEFVPYSYYELGYMYPALWVDKDIFKATVKVNYYKDSIDTLNLLGSIELAAAEIGSSITGVDLEAYHPGIAYETFGKQSGATIVSANESLNIVNVLYTKKAEQTIVIEHWLQKDFGINEPYINIDTDTIQRNIGSEIKRSDFALEDYKITHTLLKANDIIIVEEGLTTIKLEYMKLPVSD